MLARAKATNRAAPSTQRNSSTSGTHDFGRLRRDRSINGPSSLQPTEVAASSQQAEPQSSRRATAQRVSSYREDSCSLRSTALTCVSTVLIEMNSSLATSR